MEKINDSYFCVSCYEKLKTIVNEYGYHLGECCVNRMCPKYALMTAHRAIKASKNL